MTGDPLEIFRELFERAVESCAEPDAMVLSTADAGGRASGRYVLLKAVDARGFVFYCAPRQKKRCCIRQRSSSARSSPRSSRPLRARGTDRDPFRLTAIAT